MWAKIEELHAAGHDVLSTNQSTHLEMVNKGGYAYLSDLTGIQQYCFLLVKYLILFTMLKMPEFQTEWYQ